MNSDHKVREASWTKISNIGALHISIATYIAEGGKSIFWILMLVLESDDENAA